MFVNCGSPNDVTLVQYCSKELAVPLGLKNILCYELFKKLNDPILSHIPNNIMYTSVSDIFKCVIGVSGYGVF